MNNDNMNLWAAAYKTDPEATKKYKGAGGFSGTAIASLYPVQKATELFGPLGDGWGFEIVKEEFIQGGPLIDKEGHPMGCNEQTHSVTIKMWAKHNGKSLESLGIGLTPHIYKNTYGLQTDHEAQKKSLTDAIKGALKLWGFSADVFMGQHDDHEYTQALKNEMALDKAEDKAAERIKQNKEYEEWKATNLVLIKTAVSVNELNAVYKAAALKAKRHNDTLYLGQIGIAGKKRREELDANNSEEAA